MGWPHQNPVPQSLQLRGDVSHEQSENVFPADGAERSLAGRRVCFGRNPHLDCLSCAGARYELRRLLVQ